MENKRPEPGVVAPGRLRQENCCWVRLCFKNNKYSVIILKYFYLMNKSDVSQKNKNAYLLNKSDVSWENKNTYFLELPFSCTQEELSTHYVCFCFLRWNSSSPSIKYGGSTITGTQMRCPQGIKSSEKTDIFNF